MQVPDWVWIWPLVFFGVLVILFFSMAMIWTMIGLIDDIQDDLVKLEKKRQRKKEKKRAAKKNV